MQVRRVLIVVLIARRGVVRGVVGWRRCVREQSVLSHVHVAHWLVAAFRAAGVVVDEGGVDWFELCVNFDVYSLLSEDDSALALGSFDVNILRVMNDLPVVIQLGTFRLGRTRIF